MKRIWIVVLLIVAFITMLASCNKNIKYPSGKDTIHSFGDGTFQICGGSDEHKSMHHAPTGACIIDDVTDIYEIKGKIYTIGLVDDHCGRIPPEEYDAYAVIDSEENIMQVYFKPKTEGIRECWIDETPIEQGDVVRLSSFDEFSEEDQAVFKNEKLFEPVK